MSKPRVLLIQVRRLTSPMAVHEQTCIRRRLAPRSHSLEVRNVFASRPDPAWTREIDVLLIGGSGSFSVHHPRSNPWVGPLRELLDDALSRELPGFGICFGHQLLGYHLGVPVVTDEEMAEVGTMEVSLTEEGKADPLFGPMGDSFAVHTGHSDHVMGVPEGAVLLATNEQVQTQAFRIGQGPFYSTQFHPDLTGEEAQARYRCYQQDMPNASPFDMALLSRFRTGLDHSAELLGRFFDLL